MKAWGGPPWAPRRKHGPTQHQADRHYYDEQMFGMVWERDTGETWLADQPCNYLGHEPGL